MMEAGLIRVGLLEDNLEFNTLLRTIVDSTDGFVLSFAATELGTALTAYEQCPPDLLLIDLQLPDGSGLDLVSRAAGGSSRILMLTVLADRTSLLSALETGAHGYLLKDTPPQRIIEAMQEVMAGDTPISPAVAAHLLGLLRQPADSQSSRPTPREREVVQLIARGLTYAEVARVMQISVHTVGDYIKAIYRKLEVSSKSEAVFEARNQGWIRLGE
jgi:DNA-binding NarL/FixJ family response regulator